MYLKCSCGNVLTDVGAPNNVEHLLLSYYAMERLQDMIDEEVAKNCIVDSWPEIWEAAGSVDVWKCEECNRLYMNPRGSADSVIVYNVEKIGLD